MFTSIRNRIESEKGFTLIELLVVILIIGILAAIAIPSFLNQRVKGQDACAKSLSRTMQTAMETFYTDNDTYSGADAGDLSAIENQITAGACGQVGTADTTVEVLAAGCAASSTPGTDYCVAAQSASGNVFQVSRSSGGEITRTCTVPAGGSVGACKGATAGGSGTW